MVRRKPGQLLPLEHRVLATAAEIHRSDAHTFHGYAIARQLQGDVGGRRLTSHGTLYKALSRLQQAGLLSATWEDPDAAAAEDRPRRRLYEITGLGFEVLNLADRDEPLPASVISGLSPA
jgi:PadR family transcriptional regulator PadR